MAFNTMLNKTNFFFSAGRGLGTGVLSLGVGGDGLVICSACSFIKTESSLTSKTPLNLSVRDILLSALVLC